MTSHPMTSHPVTSPTMTLRTMIAAASLAAGTALAHAESVEIYALDMLDNVQAGYCLDIALGQGAQADPDDGLQGHTCYSPSGELFVDQTFDADRFAENVLYMPEFDVCAQVTSVAAGTAVEPAACDGSQAQTFTFSGEGRITSAAAPGMCLTLGEDTRTGRSDANQIKALTLEGCSEDDASHQTWGSRTAE